MQVNFANGTDRQQSLFHEAVDECVFDFGRLQVFVTVEWTSHLPDGHNEFAITTIPGTPTDGCGKPSTARILLRDNLDDPRRRGNEGDYPDGTFAGDGFYKETVIHELGHVFAGHFDPGQIAAVADAFGGSAADWPTPSGIVDWGDRLQEGQAESFKDIYLPAADRKFDDRANWHLSEAGFGRYLAMVDTVCPCGFGGESGDFSNLGPSTFPNPHGFTIFSGRPSCLLTAGNTFGPSDFDPSQVAPGPWYAIVPRLDPLSILRDNAELFGILDTDNVYWGYSGLGVPTTMTDAVGGQDFTDWPGSNGELVFRLSDEAGIIDEVSFSFDTTLADPDAVYVSIDPGSRMPTNGFASLDARVPNGFAQTAPFAAPFEGLTGLWQSMRPHGGPGDPPFHVVEAYAGGILFPVRGGGPCPPARRPPYPYTDPLVDRAPPGARKHPRQVFGGPQSSVSPSVTPVRAEETRTRGPVSKEQAIPVGLSPEDAEAQRQR